MKWVKNLNFYKKTSYNPFPCAYKDTLVFRGFFALLDYKHESASYFTFPCRNFDRGLVGPLRVCPISSRDLAWKTSQGPVGNVTLLSTWALLDFLVGV